MNVGDLVQLRYTYPLSSGQKAISDPNKVVVCYNPEVIICHNHYGTYQGIQMLECDGKINVYPIDRWIFEVISEGG